MNNSFKTLLLLLCLGVLFSSMNSCKCCHKKETVKTETAKAETAANSDFVTGTVKKLPKFVGSCAWVIETADGKRFETRDVPQEFFVDGLKVKFKYTVLEGLMSKCQTGTMIRVSEIKKLP
jgi:hypothetical protein